MRVLAATLLLACACPANAQTSPAALPQTPASEKSDADAAAKTREREQQVRAALDQSAEFVSAGKLDEAIKLLEETDAKVPEDALVASSLGAVFELKGEIDAALTWIRESIKRDANALAGSEWLHARLLVSKIALAKEPKWFQKNNVLGLDFGTAEVPVAPEILPIEAGRIKGANQLIDQIGYQLAERTKFVKPPDPVVGDLYASAGDLAIASAVSPLDDRKSKIRPEKFYERALEYGAPHADLVRKRLARYQADFAALPPLPKEEVAEIPVISKRFEVPPEKSYAIWIYVGAAIGFLVALLAVATVLDRRRRKRAEENPPPPLPDV